MILPVIVGTSILTLSCGEKEKVVEKTVSEETQNAIQATSQDDSKLEKKISEAASAAKDQVIEVVDAVKPIASQSASPEDLAKQLGFAAHLPASTEGVLAIHKLGDSFDRILKTKLGQLIIEIAKENGEDIERELQGYEMRIARAVMGEEVFVSFGAGAGKQLLNLAEVSKISNYINGLSMASMAQLWMSLETGGNMQDPGEIIAQYLLKDPEKILNLLKRSELPPVTVGIKMSNGEMREGFAAMIKGQLEKALQEEGTPLEAIEVEKHGVKWSGFKLDGEKLSAMIDAKERQNFEKKIQSKEQAEQFFKLISEKEIVVVTGVKGDYILAYAGASLDGFSLVEKASDSVLAHEELDFMNSYQGKDIRLFSFSPQSAFQDLAEQHEMFASVALGLRDGIASNQSLGDTTKLQELLTRLAKQDRELASSHKMQRIGIVGFLEEGFKIESHGGSNLPSIDFGAEHHFASFSELDRVFLFANSVTDEKFSAKVREMINTAGEIAYKLMQSASSLDLNSSELRDFKQGFDLVESFFTDDLYEIWKAFSEDLGQGIGNESAFVVDLDGSMPTIPMIPGAMVKDGKIPRIAWGAPVKDRDKIAKSWDRINTTITGILKKGEEFGMNFPMQVPFSSESDGLKSYFFTSIPFTTPNAMPAVSVSDDYFFLSTSPQFAGELAKTAQKKSVKRKGSFAQVNFQALNQFLKDWLELLKANQDEIFADDELKKNNFKRDLPIIIRVLDAAGELKNMTFHSRLEEGENRGTFHLHMN